MIISIVWFPSILTLMFAQAPPTVGCAGWNGPC
jgi:hypothetical protein